MFGGGLSKHTKRVLLGSAFHPSFFKRLFFWRGPVQTSCLKNDLLSKNVIPLRRLASRSLARGGQGYTFFAQQIWLYSQKLNVLSPVRINKRHLWVLANEISQRGFARMSIPFCKTLQDVWSAPLSLFESAKWLEVGVLEQKNTC